MGVKFPSSKFTCDDERACMFSLPLMSTMPLRREVATCACYHSSCASIRLPS